MEGTKKALATIKCSVLPSSLCSSGSLLAEAHREVLRATLQAAEDGSSSVSWSISFWSICVGGGSDLEWECGPQEGPEQRSARDPLPGTEASSIILVHCPDGQLAELRMRSTEASLSLKHVSKIVNGDVYFINKHNPLPPTKQFCSTKNED